MSEQTQVEAWLESADGSRVPIRGSCSLGRHNTNQVVLSDERVSRRHAVVHVQEKAEFWLVDLGSRNGTYLNGHRITKSHRLMDQDQIEIADFKYVFRHPMLARPAGPGRGFDEKSTERTIQNVKKLDCWLLVGDIENYTQMTQRLPQEEMSNLTQKWLNACKLVVDTHGGAMNKFIGDAFFAYWIDRPPVAPSFVAVLRALKELQVAESPRFRMVAHFGQVFLGGAASLGEESLSGPEVNFVFRMEKLASRMGQANLLSEPMHARIRDLIPTSAAGREVVPDFSGEYMFYSF